MLSKSLGFTDPDITNLTKWHGQLMSQEAFYKTESEVTGGKGISAFKVWKCLSVQPFFPLKYRDYQTLLPYQWVRHCTFFILCFFFFYFHYFIFLSEISFQYWFWNYVTMGHDLKRYIDNVQSYKSYLQKLSQFLFTLKWRDKKYPSRRECNTSAVRF